MKLLYGVQATGNGHITRARALHKHLRDRGIEVDTLFSGRPRDQFFDMEEFGDFRCLRGLTFTHKNGHLQFINTALNNNLWQFWRDIRSLELSRYDAIITDFEPITAWACKLARVPCIGMGHQYAFGHAIPRRGDSVVPRTIIKNFAPVSMGLGLHWHHFNQNILPPIAEVNSGDTHQADSNKIVVYLGFENTDAVLNLLQPFSKFKFVVYGPYSAEEQRGHIYLKPLSREGFKHDLATSGGVISNAGFELSSEALQLGKKILVKPLAGQMEQLSNAVALEKLGLGMAMDNLDRTLTQRWLEEFQGAKVVYPDVAGAIADWIQTRAWERPEESIPQLVQTTWAAVQAEGVACFSENLTPKLDLGIA